MMHYIYDVWFNSMSKWLTALYIEYIIISWIYNNIYLLYCIWKNMKTWQLWTLHANDLIDRRCCCQLLNWHPYFSRDRLIRRTEGLCAISSSKKTADVALTGQPNVIGSKSCCSFHWRGCSKYFKQWMSKT